MKEKVAAPRPVSTVYSCVVKNLYFYNKTVQNMIRRFSKKVLSNLIGNRIITIFSFIGALDFQMLVGQSDGSLGRKVDR